MDKVLVIVKPSSFQKKLIVDMELELKKNNLRVLDIKNIKIDVDFLKRLRGSVILQEDIRLCLYPDFIPVWIIGGHNAEEKTSSIQKELSVLYRRKESDLFYRSSSGHFARDLSLVERQQEKKTII